MRGKVGVYGRSIGGIAASHLVNKFPKLIKVFVGDRTMGNLDSLVQNKWRYSGCILTLYRLLSCGIRVNNSEGFLGNKGCYKINTFDENDDVVDVYSAHHQEVAK